MLDGELKRDLLEIKIQDPQKETISYNLNEEIDIFKFNKKLSSLEGGFSLQKVSDVISSNSACGYKYKKLTDYWGKDKVGFVYAIVVNKKIAKIGMSESTLNSRFSSYTAGTRKNREKGTCSVTNYYCSEFIRKCLEQGLEVEIYAFNTPVRSVVESILGQEETIKVKMGYVYENRSLEIYNSMKGCRPVLCRNTSLI